MNQDSIKSSLVSIIIPTKNSANTLEDCLVSVADQTYSNIEIIIIDCYSSDKTGDISKHFGAKFYQKNFGMTKARNYGVEKASGVYVFNMDSDMKLSSKVVEDCVQLCENGAGAVMIPQYFEGINFFGRCRALEFKCYTTNKTFRCSRFVNRAVFLKVGGYDENLEAGEDWDITQKVEKRSKVVWGNVPLIHGWGEYNLAHSIRKAYRYGKTVKKYLRKYPNQSKYQWGVLRYRYYLCRHMLKEPHHALGLIFMKCCEFFTGWLGMISSTDKV